MDAWKYEIYFSRWTGYPTRSLCSLVRYPAHNTLNEFHISAHPCILYTIDDSLCEQFPVWSNFFKKKYGLINEYAI